MTGLNTSLFNDQIRAPMLLINSTTALTGSTAIYKRRCIQAFNTATSLFLLFQILFYMKN